MDCGSKRPVVTNGPLCAGWHPSTRFADEAKQPWRLAKTTAAGTHTGIVERDEAQIIDVNPQDTILPIVPPPRFPLGRDYTLGTIRQTLSSSPHIPYSSNKKGNSYYYCTKRRETTRSESF